MIAHSSSEKLSKLIYMKEIQAYPNDKIAERDKLWQQYDQAVRTKETLISRFSSRFDNPANAKPIASLSSQNLPPDEVDACLKQLESLDSKISQEKSNIQSHENKIQELKAKSRNLIIGITLSGVVLLIVVIMVIQGQSKTSKKSPQSSLNIEKIYNLI
jgi:hypothetical protein